MSVAARRLIVVGAGPMGLEAALCALERGFEVTVLEKGRVGDALRRWGPTRFFTPLGMNLSARAKKALGAALPPEDAILSGPEMAEKVLEPLARLPVLAGRIRTGHRVMAIGRARLGRTDYPNHPVRHERVFRLLVEGPEGEVTLEAEVVLDASGFFGGPLAMGAGGLPARGESKCADRILRDLGALHRAMPELGGRRVLLVGHGHSAANALSALATLATDAPKTRVIHAVRSLNTRPFVEVPADPLPERRAIVDRANDLLAKPPAWLTVVRNAHVEEIRPAEKGMAEGTAEGTGDAVAVSLTKDRRVVVDRVIALTGFRPDLSILRELAVETSAVTEGAGRLYAAISNVTDCLTVPKVTPADLASGEPGFHLVGQKSYGRARTFLLQTGLAQLETVIANL